MERRITEEQVTKSILNWLEENGWEIICFDFPQSGTGVSLHPNEELRSTKNKGAIIPDIVAVKNMIVVFFENKDRFVLGDFIKLQGLKLGNDYSVSLDKLLKNLNHKKIFYGVGLPNTENTIKNTMENKEKIDFAIFVSSNRMSTVHYQATLIFN